MIGFQRVSRSSMQNIMGTCVQYLEKMVYSFHHMLREITSLKMVNTEFRIRKAPFSFSALPLYSYVTTDKSVNLSVPQVPQQRSRYSCKDELR